MMMMVHFVSFLNMASTLFVEKKNRMCGTIRIRFENEVNFRFSFIGNEKKITTMHNCHLYNRLLKGECA